MTLQWRHNGRDSVSNHHPHNCLLSRLFRRRSKKTSKLRVTGLCVGNSPVTGEFPAQMASNAENVSIWWRHHWDNVYSYVATTLGWLSHTFQGWGSQYWHRVNCVIVPALQQWTPYHLDKSTKTTTHHNTTKRKEYNILLRYAFGWSMVILGMGYANERRRYIVTSALIGVTHTQNDPHRYITPGYVTHIHHIIISNSYLSMLLFN